MEGQPDSLTPNCIFCQIASGKVAAQRVFEDSEFLAVLDINPANPGHMLVLTKHHYQVMPQLPDALVGRLFVVVQQLSHSVLRSIKAQGTSIFVANGAIAGQRAPHFMLHIIPRVQGDGVTLDISAREYSLGELKEARKKLLVRIREVFGDHAPISSAPSQTLPPKSQKVVHEINPAPPQPVQVAEPRFLWERKSGAHHSISGLNSYDVQSVTAFFHKHPQLVTVVKSLIDGPKNAIELLRVIDFKANHLLVLEYLGYIRPLEGDETKMIPIERRRNHPGKKFFAITSIGRRFLSDPLRPLVLSDAIKEKEVREESGEQVLPPKNFDLDAITDMLGGGK